MSGDSFAVLGAAGIAALQVEPRTFHIRHVTRPFFTLLGYSESSSFEATPLLEWINAQQRGDCSAELTALLAGQRSNMTREVSFCHASGREVVLRCTAGPVHAASGEVDRIEVIAQPVPGESELIASELDLFVQLFEDVPAAVAIHEGASHVVRYGNRRARGVIGDPETYAGFPLEEIAPPPFASPLREQLDDVFRSASPRVVTDFSLPVPAPQDPQTLTDSYWNGIFLPWRFPDGRMRGVVVFGFDVTEQVQAREERSKYQQKLELALQSGRVGVWSYELERQRFSFDERCVSLFGVEPTMTLAQLKARIPAEDWPTFERIGVQLSASESDTSFSVEHRWQMPDGSLRWLSALGQSRPNEDADERTLFGVSVDITERKRSEEALRESERRLRVALANSPVVLWEQDAELRYTWVHNPSKGYAVEGLLNRTEGEFFDRATAEKLTTLKSQVLAEGKGVRTELEIEYQGNTMWWDVTLEPTTNSQGEVTGLTGVGVDLTRRRNTELALRASEARLRYTIESARLLLFEWDIREDKMRGYGYLHDGTPVHEDDGSWGDFGSFERAIARRASPEDRESFRHAVERALYETGELEWEGHVKELPGSPLEGRTAYFHQRARVQYDAEGRPTKLHGVIVDATRRHEIEREVERHRERLQRMLEASPIGIAFVRDDGYVHECNDAFLGLLGCERDRYERDGLDVLNNCGVAGDEWRELLRAAHGHRPQPVTIPQQAGAPPSVALASVIRLNSDEEELVVFLADITDRIQMEAELRKLNEALEREVHERSQAHARLRELALQQTAVEHQERRRIAQTLHDHFQQLLVAAKFSLANALRSVPDLGTNKNLQHVESLLDEAIEASRSLAVELFPPVLYEGGLAEALEWLVERYDSLYGLRVHLEADSLEEPLSEEVKVYLYQAAHELLLNVIKHAGTREAWVTFKGEPQTVRLIVEDRGGGYDPSVLKQRLPRSRGFGLFQIQQRINLLGGEVSLDNPPKGGSRIELIVPRESAQVERSTSEATQDRTW